VRSGKIGTGEVGSAEVSLPENSPAKVGLAEVDPAIRVHLTKDIPGVRSIPEDRELLLVGHVESFGRDRSAPDGRPFAAGIIASRPAGEV
jgi:hypothetical protein